VPLSGHGIIEEIKEVLPEQIGTQNIPLNQGILSREPSWLHNSPREISDNQLEN
jgi:hypothetical protein